MIPAVRPASSPPMRSTQMNHRTKAPALAATRYKTASATDVLGATKDADPSIVAASSANWIAAIQAV